MLSGHQYPSAVPEYESPSGGDQWNLSELQDQLLGKNVQSNRQDAVSASKKFDSLLANEFTKLSIQERSKTYEELHGVDEGVDETPFLIERSLRALDEEISKIRIKPAYDLAEQQNKEYVTNPRFRLMFLRAGGFQPEKAATWLVGYFEGKLKYFGEGFLTKRIQFSDLDPNDQACVKAGLAQVLPSRDRSGRIVVVGVALLQDQPNVTATNRLKACIYIWLMAAEDEENQKRGLVMVLFQMGSMKVGNVGRTLIRELPLVMRWLPLRVCALHLCTDNEFGGFMFRAAGAAAPAHVRARRRNHIGTFTEITYALLGYGIPVDLFPTNDGLTVKTTNMNRWITKNLARDKELTHMGTFSRVDLPTNQDVLMGKGKPFQHHPGNTHLRELVEAFMVEYHTALKSIDKREVVYKVCSMIKARPGRFLEKDEDGWWRESHDVEALAKVAVLFRRTIRKEKPKQDDRVVAKLDGVDDYASMFLEKGKRPRFSNGCCGR